MGRSLFGSRRGALLLAALIAVALLPPRRLAAEKVIMEDGRQLIGRFAELSGVDVNPLNPNQGGPGVVKKILFCDDDLTRTMVPKRYVSRVDPAPLQRLEHFEIKQPVAQGGFPVSSMGAILGQKPWDGWGRRTLTMQTEKGPADVIQGLTVITPAWSKIESLQQQGAVFLLDMRISTSSLPRDLITAILARQIDRTNPDHRLRLVRFYMQAERFTDAEAELKSVVHDFPNLQGMDVQVKALADLAAKRAIAEIDTRRRAGQTRLAYGMLQSFPTDNISGPVLQEVRDKIEEIRGLQERGEKTIQLFDELLAQVKDSAIKARLEPLRKELAAELSFGTLDRLAAFRRLADDKSLLPEQRLALAVSGWLLGPDDTVDNVQVALSLAEVRNIVREYLNEPLKINRQQLLSRLGSEQAGSAKYVAKLLERMRPPVETPPQEMPGFFKLDVRGGENQADTTYYVQLPPEYDPYVKYPTVVTLSGEGVAPQQQIDWWAGLPKAAPKPTVSPVASPPAAALPGLVSKDVPPLPKPDEKGAADAPAADRPAGGGLLGGMRLGQATRHGYIVIAPDWQKQHQFKYEYSAREHAVVLAALRDACKRFSIDTDRVYLSGHSMGGDAAWDIGLAHPDLWAGVIPIVATEGKYVAFYDRNAARLPMYFVSGELDGNRTATNATQWNHYLTAQTRGYDMTLVEYQGRGHEHFSDELLRLFDWMQRKKRDFLPADFTVATMRLSDNCFWCVEIHDMPKATMVDPAFWPPPSGTHALEVKVKKMSDAANGLAIDVHGTKMTIWLGPGWIDFDRPATITLNTARVSPRQPIKPSLETLLEDARTRADRQHPFWAKLEP